MHPPQQLLTRGPIKGRNSGDRLGARVGEPASQHCGEGDAAVRTLDDADSPGAAGATPPCGRVVREIRQDRARHRCVTCDADRLGTGPTGLVRVATADQPARSRDPRSCRLPDRLESKSHTPGHSSNMRGRLVSPHRRRRFERQGRSGVLSIRRRLGGGADRVPIVRNRIAAVRRTEWPRAPRPAWETTQGRSHPRSRQDLRL